MPLLSVVGTLVVIGILLWLDAPSCVHGYTYGTAGFDSDTAWTPSMCSLE